MTANHEHTPDTARIKDAYRRSRVWESGNGSEAYEKEFDRWLATVEAAAEQRGAIKALRDAAQVMQDDLTWANTQRGLLVFEDESDPGISPFQWLENRADQMEGDDA